MFLGDNIRKINLIIFLRNLYFASAILIPFLSDWGGLSFWQIMLLESWFVFWVFILEIPTGAVADYLSHKLSIILSCLVGIIAIITYTSYPDFYVFLLAEWLAALGAALLSGADQVIIYDSLKDSGKETESQKPWGQFFSYQISALAISAPIGSWVASYWGLPYPFLLTAIPFALALLVAFTIKEPLRLKKERESERYLTLLINSIKYLYTHKILKLFIIDSVPIAALSFMIIWLYQPLLQKLDVPVIYFGWVHTALCLMQILILTNFSRLENWFNGKQHFLKWSALLTGFGFIILSASFTWPMAIIFILITSGFGLTRYPLFSNYMHKYIESSNRATVMSGVSMLKTLLQGIVYIFVGLLSTWSIDYAFLVIGLLILILTLLSQTEEKHFID